jgi:hypothetical protein
MLTPTDEEFVRGFHDRRNMLGAAVQLCTLPWLGFVPDDVPSAPTSGSGAPPCPEHPTVITGR